jgi:large subunit ribosomal protein L17
MRHNRKVNHLGRQTAHRGAMIANMANSLIIHKRINTTVAKARVLRKFVEPLITKSKVDSTHSRREVFSFLQDKVAVTELFRDIAVKVADRPGGYTRILKTGRRLGDNADMCLIELVDYNENLLSAKEQKAGKAKTRRRGAGTTKKETTVAEPKAKKEEKTEKSVKENEVAEAKAEVVAEVAHEEVVAKTEEVVEDKIETPSEPETEKTDENQPEETK